MTVSEKVAFLKGLMEGSGVDQESKYGKLFAMTAEILEELAGELAELRKVTDALAEDADDMREDLGCVEDIVYAEDGPDFPEDGPDFPAKRSPATAGDKAFLPGGRIPVHGKRPAAPEGKPPQGCPRCCAPESQADWEEYWDGEDDEEEDGVFYEVTCPHCHETITVDEDVLDLGTIQCPNCGEMMELGLEVSEDGDGGDLPLVEE